LTQPDDQGSCCGKDSTEILACYSPGTEDEDQNCELKLATSSDGVKSTYRDDQKSMAAEARKMASSSGITDFNEWAGKRCTIASLQESSLKNTNHSSRILPSLCNQASTNLINIILQQLAGRLELF
jgi:hypothetical protein